MKRQLGAWKENLPQPLIGAQLVLSEKDIYTALPVPMHGRADQVFLSHGWLIPVDTKTRKIVRVYPKDVVQLSVYAFILARSSSALFGREFPVASTGYVRCVTGREVTYVPVKLIPSAQVIGLWNRYWELKKQGVAARPRTAEPHVCAGCVKRQGCSKGKRVAAR